MDKDDANTSQNGLDEHSVTALLEQNEVEAMEQSGETNEPTMGSNDPIETDLHTALKQKMDLRCKLLKTEHHIKFLQDCTEKTRHLKAYA